MPLKRHHPDLMFSGNKVTPDEIDQDQQYVIINPSVDPVYLGTVVGTQTETKAIVLVNSGVPDYPRSVVFAIAAAAGSARGGSATINGVDQFGSTVSESLAVSPATGGGTTSGTQVFGSITSGTAYFGTGNAGNGSARLGVGIGTSATRPVFGLPAKLGSVTDIKTITWIDADTAKFHAGTASANTTLHGVVLNVAGGIAAADSFVIKYRSSFNATADGNIAKT